MKFSFKSNTPIESYDFSNLAEIRIFDKCPMSNADIKSNKNLIITHRKNVWILKDQSQ